MAVPGDKSLSHRALLLGAMSPRRARIRNPGPGLDVAATAAALRALGTGARRRGGVDTWSEPKAPIDCANSGTTLRLLAGAAAGRTFETVLVGDPSLMRRPMTRLVTPLAALGAEVLTDDGTPPVRVRGGHLIGAQVGIDIPSAQVRTAVALAALQADGETSIDSPPGFRDHTERWFEALALGRRRDATRFDVYPGPVPRIDVSIPGDPSSAAFLWAAAALVPGARVHTPDISLNPGRLGFLAVLERMGAIVTHTLTGDVLGDPVGEVTVTGASLGGIRIEGEDTAACIDELPLVAVVAAFAEGHTVVGDAAELRVKESDRIATTVGLINALDGAAEEMPDGFSVSGRPLTAGVADAGGDHRIAMAAAVAATAGGRVHVEGFEAASVSWPGFADTLERLWSLR